MKTSLELQKAGQNHCKMMDQNINKPRMVKLIEKIISKTYGPTRKVEVIKNNENLFCLKVIDLSSDYENYTSTFLTREQIKELLAEIYEKI